VPQNPGLVSGTIAENIALGIDPAEIEKKITKVIKTMETEFPNNPNWKKHLEDLDYLYIQLFRSVQYHPRLRHPGGVHHVTLK
jgi:ABC-type multidrug transport system fused ATPase/permease subunit